MPKKNEASTLAELATQPSATTKFPVPVVGQETNAIGFRSITLNGKPFVCAGTLPIDANGPL